MVEVDYLSKRRRHGRRCFALLSNDAGSAAANKTLNGCVHVARDLVDHKLHLISMANSTLHSAFLLLAF